MPKVTERPKFGENGTMLTTAVVVGTQVPRFLESARHPVRLKGTSMVTRT